MWRARPRHVRCVQRSAICIVLAHQGRRANHMRECVCACVPAAAGGGGLHEPSSPGAKAQGARATGALPTNRAHPAQPYSSFTLCSSSPRVSRRRFAVPRPEAGRAAPVRPGSKRARTAVVARGWSSWPQVAHGQVLGAGDIGPMLRRRHAELFWPDDASWYLIEIQVCEVQVLMFGLPRLGPGGTWCGRASCWERCGRAGREPDDEKGAHRVHDGRGGGAGPGGDCAGQAHVAHTRAPLT